MNYFSYLLLTFVSMFSLNAMQDNFSITLLVTNDQIIPSQEEITVKNYSSFCIPLVMPKQKQDALVVKGRYTGQSGYILTHGDKDSEYAPLSRDSNNTVYKQQDHITQLLMFDKSREEYVYVQVLLNRKHIAVPLSEHEKIYAYFNLYGKEYLQEFTDTDKSDSQESLLSYEPTKSFLSYLESNDVEVLQKNIHLVQGYDPYGTGMAFEELGIFKNAVVSTINKKIDRLKKEKK